MKNEAVVAATPHITEVINRPPTTNPDKKCCWFLNIIVNLGLIRIK